MMKKILVAVLATAAVVVVLAMTLWRHDNGTGYRLVDITRGDVREVVTSTGTLQALTTVQVGTQVSGEVSKIYVDFNDHVKKGEIIARIDPVLLEQAVRTAEADLARNQAEYDQRKREFDRIERLYQKQAATESEFNTAQYQLDVAKASLESSKISVERARRNLGYTEIRAPVDGVVLDRTVDEGQTVAASFSAPQLFLIAEDLSKMEILATVDESDIGKIHDGQAVDFSVQAYPDSTFTGTVKQVRLNSVTQENVVNYVVVIGVANPTGLLLPGMTATVQFIIAQANDVLRVSNSALRFRPTNEMLVSWRKQRGGERPDSARSAHMPPGAHGSRPERPRDRAMLWTLDEDGSPSAVFVRTGITDGQYTEISGRRIDDGMQVVAAIVKTSTNRTASNPFQGEQRSRRHGPPPMM